MLKKENSLLPCVHVHCELAGHSSDHYWPSLSANGHYQWSWWSWLQWLKKYHSELQCYSFYSVTLKPGNWHSFLLTIHSHNNSCVHTHTHTHSTRNKKRMTTNFKSEHKNTTLPYAWSKRGNIYENPEDTTGVISWSSDIRVAGKYLLAFQIFIHGLLSKIYLLF